MTDTDSAKAGQRLREAAAKLRSLLANPQLTEGPWLSLDHGDRILRNQPGDEDQAPVYVVDEPMSNGANADYIEAMHPGVGEPLAAWLELEADVIASRAAQPEGGEWAVDTGGDHALAVADAILGSAS